VVMSWALAKWAVRMCWLEHRKGQAAVMVGKEVGQGKMDGGPSAGKKKKGASWSGLEIWPMADIEKRNIFFFYFSNLL
jgi:hypothetical protein